GRLIRHHSQDATSPGLTEDDYRRVLELGRTLALMEDDDVAFDQMFLLWFRGGLGRAGSGETARPSFTVAAIVDFLIRGTEDDATKRILERRVDNFSRRWEANAPLGLGFALT